MEKEPSCVDFSTFVPLSFISPAVQVILTDFISSSRSIETMGNESLIIGNLHYTMWCSGAETASARNRRGRVNGKGQQIQPVEH